MNTYAIRSTLVRALGVALGSPPGLRLPIRSRLTDLGMLGGGDTQGLALNARVK